MPSLAQADGNDAIVAIDTGTSRRSYAINAGSYVAEKYVLDGLVHSGSYFVSTDTMGNQTFYHDWTVSPAGKRGQFDHYVDAAGNVTYVVSYNAAGNPQEVRLKDSAGVDRQSWVYTYISNGTNAGLVSNINYRVSDGAGGWTNARQVDYAYYDGTGSYGLAGDLKTAQIKDPSGNVIETKYYRWYTTSSSVGYAHGLQMIFEGAAYNRLNTATGNALTASESTAKQYADNYFEYDGYQRVTQEIAHGVTYNYAYTLSVNAPEANAWNMKTVETMDDGMMRTIYTNGFGQVMLNVQEMDGDLLGTFHVYDADGRRILKANPSAVDLSAGLSTLEAYPDLLHKQSGNYEYLRDSAGLVETWEFATSTTATTSTAGDANGYYKSGSLRRGETGTSVPQDATDYIARSAGGNTFYNIAHQIAYSATNGTGGLTTAFSYTYHGTTAAVLQLDTTLPTVGAEHNGSGSAIVSKTVFDLFGRPTWTRDGDGFFTRTTYDPITGAITQFIDDVDTTQTSDEPSGWNTSSDGGLHLTTSMQLDALGRTTKLTDPRGNDTYYVYKDADHEARVYAGWDSVAKRPTGPTYVAREDWANSYSESLSMTATPATNGAGLPTGGEAISAVQSLSRTFVNNLAQVTHVDRYFSFSGLSYSSGTALGTINTHFSRTSYGYDMMGMVNRTVLPTGTITRLVYDMLGRLSSTWVGTDDEPTTPYFTPTNTAGTDMTKVEARFYDVNDSYVSESGMGDSNLTAIVQSPNDGSSDRTTQFLYDWRNRLVATSVEAYSALYPITITYRTLNNLGQETVSELYDGDNITLYSSGLPVDSNNDGIPDAPDSANRRARVTYDYDELGQVWRTQTFSITQSGTAAGTISSNSLKSWNWYDNRGNPIKTLAPGGLASKYKIDGAGRVIKQYLTDGGGDALPGTSGSWDNATHVTGDNVLEQTESQYDANSNLIFSINKLHFHDDANTGELSNISGTPKARVSYTAFYYDKANRLTDIVDVGTNAGSSYTRPSSAPTNRSNTLLLTHYDFDDANGVTTVTDPKGIASKTYFDLAGRTAKTISAYVDGTPSAADDQTTEYAYDGSDHVLTMKAVLPNSGTNSVFQTTQYVYGVTAGGGSDITSNDLLKEIRYPDKATGSPSTNSANIESFRYNALGETTEMTDRNGNVHAYSRDPLGRLTTDEVTTFGSGVDETVKKLTWTFDGAGRLSTSSSRNASNDVINQIQREYNGYGQLTTEYQEHTGEVNTGTSPKVQYVYTEGGTDVSDNDSRLTKMIYPNGRVLRYEYGTTGALNEKVSRLAYLADEANNSPSTHIEEYSYLGASTVVVRNRPSANSKLTYVKLSGESNGDAGDQYTGLDRFGRIADQRWVGQSGSNVTTLDRFQYGYDANSNPLYKDNKVNSTFSELYHANGTNAGYDSLNRLTDFRRGTLSDSNSDGAFDTVSTLNTLAGSQKNWNLDAVGNWNSETTDGTAVNRTHDLQNELTAVGSTNLTYDNAGSLTVDQDGHGLVYDAWNRLVTVKSTPSGSAIQEYTYDAAGHRISQDSGTLTDLYYSANWQVLEERESELTKTQYVWSHTYIDELIERDRDVDGDVDGTLDSSFDSDGKLTTHIGTNEQARVAAIQSDGKMLVAGTVDGDTAVVRYNKDGSLDSSFGTNGISQFRIGTAANTPRAIALQVDGKILVGASDASFNYDLARLNADGSLDNSFDSDGKISWYEGGAIAAISASPDGKILIAGDSGGAPTAMRFNSDGSFDNSFGNFGVAYSEVMFENGVNGAAFQADGKIVFVGVDVGNADMLVYRMNADGSADTSFSGDGLASALVDSSATTMFARAAAIQADGKILGIARVTYNGSDGDVAVLRFNTDGTLDTSFDSDGRAIFDMVGSSDSPIAMRLQSDGRIVIASAGNSDFNVARMHVDGTLDTNFDSDGIVSTDFSSSSDSPAGLVIGADYKITVLGRKLISTNNYDWAIARYKVSSGLEQRLQAQTDANHNVTSIADVFGAVKQRFVYDPYGKPIVLTANFSTTSDAYSWRVGFQGGLMDSVTHNWHFRNRDLNSYLGRWFQADPIGYPDGANRYELVLSSPLKFVDPLGLGTHEDGTVFERCRVKNVTQRPILAWRDRRDPKDPKKRASEWRVLMPQETTPEGEDWDYVFANERWWKVKPEYNSAAIRVLSLWNYHACTRFAPENSGSSIIDLSTAGPVAFGSDANQDGPGWYPGCRPFDSKVPEEYIKKYEHNGGKDADLLRRSQLPTLRYDFAKKAWNRVHTFNDCDD